MGMSPSLKKWVYELNIICFVYFQKTLEMTAASDKPNAYHEGQRFVSRVLGSVLVQTWSKRFVVFT